MSELRVDDGKVVMRIEDGKMQITTRGLCDLLEVTDKTLTNWRRQGCPQASRGWWELQDVLKWRGMIQAGEDAETKKGVNLQFKKLETEIAYKESQAELSRIKADLAAGKYVEREFVEMELSRFFLVFKKSATALTRKLGNIISAYADPLEARRAEQEVANTINDALEQLSVDGVYSAKKAKRSDKK
ncbi:hypothetical protein ACOMCU_24770 [Lysinibacillus sp. UGB7]|uniref:hypothetical protein n=1 Tax=Lysinibacillus sp. UGB7 TaxID=3411039 RepID=UPI003B7AB9FD